MMKKERVEKMEKKNIFSGIPDKISDELFETIVESHPVKIERIISCGQATSEGTWYDQDLDEWVLLLRGSAEILFDGDEDPVTLNPGDHFRIHAHMRHRVTRTATAVPTVWLAVHFP